MKVLELKDGTVPVVSAPDGDLPAPETISGRLLALWDGRLFMLDGLRGNPEAETYEERFFEYLEAEGRGGALRKAWIPEPLLRSLREKVRSDRAKDPSPAPAPEEASVPDSLADKVVFHDGGLYILDGLRGDPEVERVVRQISLRFEANGTIGEFRTWYVDERLLRTLSKGKRRVERTEDPAALLGDVDLSVPSEPPRQASPAPDPEPVDREPEPTCSSWNPEASGPKLPPSGEPPSVRSAETTAVAETFGRTSSEGMAECLSSPSGNTITDFAASPEIAPMVLLFSDGRFYASREHRTNQHVNYYCRHFVPELWAKVYTDRPVPRPQFVSYETLRKIRRDHFPEELSGDVYKAEGDEARKVMEIIRDAIQKKASDIHIRIEKDRTRVLYRIHGWLKPVQSLTHDEGERLARIVYNTMLDSSGRDTMFSDKKPQDGQFRQDYLPRGVFNIREFHAPTLGAGLGTITMVLRLQYGSGGDAAQVTDIDTLGYDARHLAQIRFLMGLSHGIILFAGPMGSGKSTSMAAVLAIVLSMNPVEDGRGLHLVTLEDPPEYVIPTASQIAVPGGRFSEVLGRIMRFDANILMIGEIRDEATAEKAIEGAMSGHVVYSTVHSNDVLSIPRRLDGLKVRRDLLADPTIFRGMICQRLVPLVCPECRLDGTSAQNRGILALDLARRLEAADADPRSVFFQNPKGCGRCGGQGIIGRTVIAEILVPDQEILDLISAGRMTDAWKHFREVHLGRTMMDHALDKIRGGLVDPRDVEAKLGWLHKGLFDPGTVRTIVGGFS